MPDVLSASSPLQNDSNQVKAETADVAEQVNVCTFMGGGLCEAQVCYVFSLNTLPLLWL